MLRIQLCLKVWMIVLAELKFGDRSREHVSLWKTSSLELNQHCPRSVFPRKKYLGTLSGESSSRTRFKELRNEQHQGWTDYAMLSRHSWPGGILPHIFTALVDLRYLPRQWDTAKIVVLGRSDRPDHRSPGVRQPIPLPITFIKLLEAVVPRRLSFHAKI